MSDSHQKTLLDKSSPSTEKLSSVAVEHASPCADLDVMIAPVQQMKDSVDKSLADVCMEVQKKYNDIVEAVKHLIQADLVNGWIKMKTHFQV